MEMKTAFMKDTILTVHWKKEDLFTADILTVKLPGIIQTEILLFKEIIYWI